MHHDRELQLIDPKAFSVWLRPRPRDCHKGDFGNVGIVGGAPGMAGAALLTAKAALLLGAGRVYCALLDERVAVDFQSPEVMIATPETVLGLPAPACLVLGPGLGHSAAARQWLEAALDTPHALLLDADALNQLAADPALQERLRQREAPTLLTPHPGEAGRLLGLPTSEVQADRPGSIRQLAQRYGALVVLKGCASLIHAPGGTLWQNSSGNPGMAAPGMGDVLAGIIAALLAQGLDPERAARLGVYVHGAAADRAVSQGLGPIGLSASEVAYLARGLFNELTAQR